MQGRNRLWEQCPVRLDAGDGPLEERMFGTILERDARFKVGSCANDR